MKIIRNNQMIEIGPILFTCHNCAFKGNSLISCLIQSDTVIPCGGKYNDKEISDIFIL